ncbi:hypothetical protein ASPBRDRAFT_69311 [Aspergillus brasiliensis CBS 101740]|uniref:Uncharacterized protein n=1 Tax=Aspergillus brasiliensis (strain CBS 101740 / IMI 381727 / IBT 21946) TaxID=767769 RepID=A0A1L9U6L2_ASPBC|nr:hypothetical protein ASPBRDRAFT_69311 [Aspergillus brasiliensis CBS 101740]
MPEAYGIIRSYGGNYLQGSFQVDGTPYVLNLTLNNPPSFMCTAAKLTYDSVDQLTGSNRICDGHVVDKELEIVLDAGSGGQQPYPSAGFDGAQYVPAALGGKRTTITGSLDYPVEEAPLAGRGDWAQYNSSSDSE